MTVCRRTSAPSFQGGASDGPIDRLRTAGRTLAEWRDFPCPWRRPAFDRPRDFDPVAHVQEALASAPWSLSVEVLLELSLEQARARVPPTEGILEQLPDGVLLRLGADSLDWAAHYLAGLDCRFTVRRPPELREALRRLASQLAEDASRG